MNTAAPTDHALGFAPDEDSPIGYMQRTREWYLALGYGNPYRWAHYADAPPFTRPVEALAECSATIVTTAAPYREEHGPLRRGGPYNGAAKFHQVYSGDTAIDHKLRIDHVAIDRKHTSMEDSGTWFPLPALRRAVQQGRVGKLAPRFHGAPTNWSQRRTIEVDAPEIVARCRADRVDVALLVANCPVCHQTLSLVARQLEAAGIATVVMGCAKDIVEHAGVPRFLFSDFPLGNAAGRPHDLSSQDATLELALRVLESAPAARTTVQSPQRWSDSADWKLDYSNAARVAPEELARLRAEFDAGKATARQLREPG
jgi:D-proline reductase (dithiol) PrdB